MAGSDASQRRPEWRAVGTTPGERWRLHKVRCGHHRQAVCELWTHEHGWELRLVIDGSDLRNSHVAHSTDEIVNVTERWKAAMVEHGWS